MLVLVVEFASRRLPWYVGATTQEGSEAGFVSYLGFVPERFYVAMVNQQRAPRRGARPIIYRGIAVNEFTHCRVC